MAGNNEELNYYLKRYYDCIFPSNLMFNWLSYGKEDIFSKREFSFTIDNDVYIRYQSFENVKEFTDELKKKVPRKIDIGAVYNIKPKLSKGIGGTQMVPLWKEFVFDIDMTDYDDIRFCCGSEEVKICDKCWTLMKAAVRILDRIFREDFGYNKIMWVYSGRRGVHCWISDFEARRLSNTMRSAIVEYSTLVKGSKEKKKVTLFEEDKWVNKYHPSIVKAIVLAKPYFVKYALKDQCLLDRPESVKKILQMLPKEIIEIHDTLQGLWSNEPTENQSEIRWRTMTDFFEQANYKKVLDEIMLECVYPRLDANVSTSVNHLLKSPFCVHPGTGRICVPFRADEVESFDPFKVPTVQEVLQEMTSVGDVMLTSLGPYLTTFEEFVNSLSND